MSDSQLEFSNRLLAAARVAGDTLAPSAICTALRDVAIVFAKERGISVLSAAYAGVLHNGAQLLSAWLHERSERLGEFRELEARGLRLGLLMTSDGDSIAIQIVLRGPDGAIDLIDTIGLPIDQPLP